SARTKPSTTASRIACSRPARKRPSDVAGNVARFLGREYQAMQGRGSAHSSAMGATEDAAARRVIAGQGPGERCRLHHQLLARSEQVRARSDGGAKGVERLVAV